MRSHLHFSNKRKGGHEISIDNTQVTFFARRFEEKESEFNLTEFEKGATGPTDRKKRNRTMKNSKESSATCPVMKPFTKSKAELVLKEVEVSVVAESIKSIKQGRMNTKILEKSYKNLTKI